jgi:arylformamidase
MPWEAQHGAVTDYRAEFDADVTFRNGGGLRAQGFRLDVASPEVTGAEVAELFVRDLRLLLVDRVTVTGLRVVEEQHRRPPGTPEPPRHLVELNHVVAAGMATYPGLPGPEITPHLTREESRASYAEGTEFQIDRISMVGNTGTYLDSPFHRYADGIDLAGLPLSSVADLPVVVVRLPGTTSGPDRTGRAVGADALLPFDVGGHAVLLHTGWDRHWGRETYGDEDAPYLTGPAAAWLVGAGARLVGIDAVNIDSTGDGTRPAHSILLAAGIPVLEHLTGLDRLPVTGARLHAAPLRIKDVGTMSVRAYACVPA